MKWYLNEIYLADFYKVTANDDAFYKLNTLKVMNGSFYFQNMI